MNFDLTEDQKMLVNTARSFAAKESPPGRLRRLRDGDLGFEPRVWRQMGELGWLGIPIPESLGGFGGRFIDAAVVIEQLGTTLVPEPYIPSIVLAGMTLLEAGDAEQQKRWLPALVGGERTMALAWAERGSRYDVTRVDTRAARDGSGWRLDGEKVFVLGGHAADQLIVSARTAGNAGEAGGVGLFVIDRDAAGLTVTSVATMDGQRAAILRLDGVVCGDEARLGDEGGAAVHLEAAMDRGAAAACAEGVGIGQRVLDMTVDYLKTREQFGTKIGSFQALQHRAVNMFVQVETCRSMMILAGLEIDCGDAERRASAVSAAKVQLSTGGRYITAQAVQLHGGIGCTDEHDVGLYFKRMQCLAMMFGDEQHHVARYGALPAFTAGLDAGSAA